MMLIEIGFRPNNLFISNSSKYFPTCCSPYAHISREINIRSRPIFFNHKKTNLVKRSLTMPYSEEGTHEGKTSVSKCLEMGESDLDLLKGRHLSLNPFRHDRSQKMNRKAPRTDFINGNRLAVEFPMILNLGSVYSSHVVVYLDP